MKKGNYTLIPADNRYTDVMRQLVFDVLVEYGLEPGAIDFCLDDVEKHYFGGAGRDAGELRSSPLVLQPISRFLELLVHYSL